jgi:hypothetical protein
MDEEIAEIVREHGWFAANVYDGDPAFHYTIGLMTTWAHPELIIFGLPPDTLYSILATMVEGIKNGKSYRDPGSYSNVLKGEVQVGVRRVDPTQHQFYLGYAMGHLTLCGRMGELEAMQVFWPDKRGVFPYEVGCDSDVYRFQPRLDLAKTPAEIEEFEREYGN